MKKIKLNQLKLFVVATLGAICSSNAQFTGLIPNNTATHTAIKNGNWSDPTTWNSNSVPGLSSIVVIPSGNRVNYNSNSNNHVFAIRNDGTINITAPNGSKTKLVVDTFVNSMGSTLDINSEKATDGTIEIVLKPFDIEGKKSNRIAGTNWNNNARNHFSDNGSVYNHFGNKLPNDGPGVLGRYGWDPAQISLCLVSASRTRILGRDKTDFLKVSRNATRNSNQINLSSAPTRWAAGDFVMITGTQNINDSEIAQIKSINGGQITLEDRLKKDHLGYSNRNWFPYVANMSRSITVRSDVSNTISQRGHSMFMHTPDLIVKNAAFVELGRTDKSNIIDDFKFRFTYNGSGNQTDIKITGLDYSSAAPKDIENQRGRYGFHFHKTFAGGREQAIAEGNVVWGSPGWGMVHHDSNASFVDNVVYGAFGGGMIAESGSETGIWRHNLVAAALKSPTSPLRNGMTAPIKRTVRTEVDDDFKTGSAYGLQGRAVRMVDNIAASSTIAYSYQSSGRRVPVADKVDASEFPLDMFPLQNKIDRDLPSLIEFKGNESAACRNSFKSQIRQQGFHRVQSIIEDLVGWNNSQFTVYLSTNFGYTLKDCIFHTREPNRTVGALIITPMDNMNWNNVVYDGYTDVGIDGNSNRFDAKARFLFHKVTWLNSTSTPYRKLKALNTVIVPTLRNGPLTLDPNSNMDTVINVNNGDYRVVVDGTVKDSAGDSEFGHFLPRNNVSLMRVYNFKDKATLENYVAKYGTFSDANGKYTRLTEYISDRLTGEVTPIEFKIRLRGFTGPNNPGTKATNPTPGPVLGPDPIPTPTPVATPAPPVAAPDTNTGDCNTTTEVVTNNDAFLQNGTRFNTRELRVEPNKRESFLKFVIPNLNGSIVNAKLQLRTSTDSGDGVIQIIRGNNNRWNENSLDNNNRPREGAVIGTLSGPFRPNTVYEWELLNISAEQTISLIVKQIRGNDVSFISKEGSVKPRLVLEVNCNNTSGQKLLGNENNNSSVVLYPNPAEELVTVSGLQNGEHVVIYSINGVKLTEVIATGNELSIPVGSFASGLYIVSIIDAIEAKPHTFRKLFVK